MAQTLVRHCDGEPVQGHGANCAPLAKAVMARQWRMAPEQAEEKKVLCARRLCMAAHNRKLMSAALSHTHRRDRYAPP
jgi:hypothetical protein